MQLIVTCYNKHSTDYNIESTILYRSRSWGTTGINTSICKGPVWLIWAVVCLLAPPLV